jgi:hypothetical protein
MKNNEKVSFVDGINNSLRAGIIILLTILVFILVSGLVLLALDWLIGIITGLVVSAGFFGLANY